ncbi:MAG: hypothetical protein HKN03_01035 [Acidimicrobiales bacterium]|nr:hypothetical protein [Acidimicrobiales bacterium]
MTEVVADKFNVEIDDDEAAAIVAEAEESAVHKADERLAYQGVFQRLLIRPEVGALIGAVAIWAFFWAVANTFGIATGFGSILDVAAPLGIMAVAVSLLMIGGEFDLSSGAATGTFGIITILLVKDMGELGGAGLSLHLAIPISLMIALFMGYMNGTVVEKTGLPSFIVTLATFYVYRGFKLGFSKLIIDNISVGRIDEARGTPNLEPGAEGYRAPGGYDFWRPVFDGVWSRNDHLLGSRDALWLMGWVLGGTLIAVAVYEMNFRRVSRKNPVGLVVMVLGMVGAAATLWYLHNFDGRTENALASLFFLVSALAGFGGLALWRYERQTIGSTLFTNETLQWTVGGLLLMSGGIIIAGALDVESQQSVLDLAGALSWPLVILAGVGGGYMASRTIEGFADQQSAARSAIAIVALGAASAFAVYGFMFMTTEQGFRAILLGAMVIGGVIALAIAAHKARRVSPIAKGLVLTALSLMTLWLAWFVQGESRSTKFRSEAFGVILLVAGGIFVWAVISTLFATRREDHLPSARLAELLAKAGLVLLGIGILARLLFTTEAELAAGRTSPVNFRMSVLWFVGVTAFATWLLGSTRFGSWIFAVGGNKQAARQIGVPAARTKTQLFMIVAVAAWLVGLLLAFRLNTLQSGTGNGLEFEYIIAAVVGGSLLTGGYGSAFGAAMGAMIVAMSKQGIPASRWNSDWQFAFLGIILLLAVIGNNYIKTKAEAAGR